MRESFSFRAYLSLDFGDIMRSYYGLYYAGIMQKKYPLWGYFLGPY